VFFDQYAWKASRARAPDSPAPGEDMDVRTARPVEGTIRGKKPFIALDATQITVERAVKTVMRFIGENEITVLNVAGPRFSGWPAGYEFGLHVIGGVIESHGQR